MKRFPSGPGPQYLITISSVRHQLMRDRCGRSESLHPICKYTPHGCEEDKGDGLDGDTGQEDLASGIGDLLFFADGHASTGGLQEESEDYRCQYLRRL